MTDDLGFPQWHNAVAGSVAGAGSRLATAPLDLIRIRRQLETSVTYPRKSLFQSFRDVMEREGGLRALFRGNVAATYLWVGYAAVQFTLYGRAQSWLRRQQVTDDPVAIAFVSGAFAGVCATLATYPFDICRTTFAARGVILEPNKTASTSTSSSGFRPPRSLYEFALHLYKQNGVMAFYAGSKPAIVQIIPYMGINFAIYEYLTHNDRRVTSSGLAGSTSGAISKIIVYPVDTVKKRLQMQAVFGVESLKPEHHRYTGMVDCIRTMLRYEGVASFYKGLFPSVLKTTVATGLSFAFFRLTKNVLESLHERSQRQDQKQLISDR